MRSITDLVKDEPVAITAFVAAVANVMLAAGVEISGELVAAVNVAIAALFFLVRWLVTPEASATSRAEAAYEAGLHHAEVSAKEKALKKR